MSCMAFDKVAHDDVIRKTRCYVFRLPVKCASKRMLKIGHFLTTFRYLVLTFYGPPSTATHWGCCLFMQFRSCCCPFITGCHRDGDVTSCQRLRRFVYFNWYHFSHSCQFFVFICRPWLVVQLRPSPEHRRYVMPVSHCLVRYFTIVGL